MLALALSLAAACPASQEPAPDPEILFREAYSALDELRAAEDWDGLRTAIEALLAEHEGRPYVVVHRPQILEDLLRARFAQTVERPHPRDLISGSLKRWSPSQGNVRIYYEGDSLQDWLVVTRRGLRSPEGHYDPFDLYVHPLPFAGQHSLTIEGRRYPEGSQRLVPLVIAGWGWEGAYLLTPGAPGIEAPSLAWHQGPDEDSEPELVDEGPAVARAGRPFKVKVDVASTSIRVTYDGQRVLQVRKPSDRFGLVGFKGFSDIERIVLEGKGEPAWLQGLVDRHVQERWLEYLSEIDPQEALPEWLRIEPRDWELDWSRLEVPDGGEQTASAQFAHVLELVETQPARAMEYARALEAGSTDILRDWALAIAHHAQHQELEALTCCERVSRADPGFLPARRAQVDLLLSLGRREQAAGVAAGLVEDDPGDSFGHSRAALLALLAGDRDAAEAAVRRGAEAGAYDARLDLVNRMLVRSRSGPSWGTVFEERTEHYVVRSDIDRRTCADAARVLERALELFRQACGERAPVPDEPFEVYLFSGLAGYQLYALEVALDPMESTRGVYLDHLKQLLIWNTPIREEMLATVRHESFHQYLYAVAPDAPRWLHEGMAQYWEKADLRRLRDRQVPVRQDLVQLLTREDVSLTPLEHFLGQSAGAFMEQPDLHYSEAWAFVHFLRNSNRRNARALDLLVEGLIDGRPYAEAFGRAFDGVDLPALQRELEEYLRELR